MTQTASPHFELEGRPIGSGHPPYIIAELSANHNGSLEQALAIIDAIAETGADAVKLQTYTADTMTLDSDRPDFQLTEGPWAGRSLYELYEWAHTPWEWHEALFQRGRERGLTVFSSPFDATAVDFLEDFEPAAYKIASFELVDLPLIEYAASKGRPLIMSTGMATRTEVMEAVATARRAGCEEICLLHCTSGYPTPPEEADLRTLPVLGERYGVVPGLSDHTLEMAVPVAATALGACVIEKHVTMRRADGGPDAAFSLEPEELRDLVEQTRTAWQALGCVREGPRESEATQRPLRRSLYVAKDMKAGEVFTSENVKSVRPGYGLEPKYYEALLGAYAIANIDFGSPVKIQLIQSPTNRDKI
ncbi:pseudaminic acid synthase [Halorhodospira neutriphila]|uniref:Pseudaminic acid synthase n=1 Tax=Halorhodospira neutriphila TaxID=168379 RepID=A0ABS1E147_9GAMM|nr:pseudaminic acid synthase [Halorhodospira neutriphila]MBK1725448.1 pseudaminic acid synthase [Halorhodospira neutriphila]